MRKTEVNYAAAMTLQERLVRRGALRRVEHDVRDAYFTAIGTDVVCTCGAHLHRPDDESERAYAEHVLGAVRASVAAVAA